MKIIGCDEPSVAASPDMEVSVPITPDAGSEGTIQARLRAVLERLEPAPALVINLIGDVVGTTRGAELLFGPIGMLDGSPSNLSRYMFTDPRARTAFPDWESVADRVAVQLRLDSSPETGPLIEEMTRVAGSAFADRMTCPLVVPGRHGEVGLNHPVAGSLRLTYETLDLFIVEEQHMLVYLPADEATTQLLDQLIAGH